MGEALVSRIVLGGIYAPDEILVSDPVEVRRSVLQERYGIQVTSDNSKVATAQEILLLAIKPQVFAQVVPALGRYLLPSSAIVSILAGTTLAQLEGALPGKAVIRAMPNTPAQVGSGVTAIASGQYVKPEQLVNARAVLESVGSVVEIGRAHV